MKVELSFNDGTHEYRLRPIRYRDQNVLADLLSEWPGDDSWYYHSGFAIRDIRLWIEEHKKFQVLPCKDPQALTLMMDVDGVTVGYCRLVFWFDHAVIHNVAVLEEFQGSGYFKKMQLMLRDLITPLNVGSVSFTAITKSLPAVDAVAQVFKLTPGDTVQGATGPLIEYSYTKEDYEAVKADPKSLESQMTVSLDIDVLPAGKIDDAQEVEAVPAETRSTP